MSNPRLHKRHKKKKALRKDSTDDSVISQKKLSKNRSSTLKSTEKYIIVAIAIFCIAGISLSYGIHYYIDNRNQQQDTNTTQTNTNNGQSTSYAFPYTITTIGGHTYPFKSFQGKIIILSFMAVNGSGDTDCNSTMQTIQYVYNNTPYSNETKVFAVDEGGDSVLVLQQYQKGLSVGFDFCTDLSEFLRNSFNVSTVPTTVVLDQNGHYYNTWVGSLNLQSIITAIDNLES